MQMRFDAQKKGDVKGVFEARNRLGHRWSSADAVQYACHEWPRLIQTARMNSRENAGAYLEFAFGMCYTEGVREHAGGPVASCIRVPRRLALVEQHPGYWVDGRGVLYEHLNGELRRAVHSESVMEGPEYAAALERARSGYDQGALLCALGHLEHSDLAPAAVKQAERQIDAYIRVLAEHPSRVLTMKEIEGIITP